MSGVQFQPSATPGNSPNLQDEQAGKRLKCLWGWPRKNEVPLGFCYPFQGKQHSENIKSLPLNFHSVWIDFNWGNSTALYISTAGGMHMAW